MMKTKFIIILFLVQCVASRPLDYYIHKLPQGVAPVLDGNLEDWDEAYFIDSIRNDNNVFVNEDPVWTPEDLQFYVYGAYDAEWVYFAMKITRDDHPISDPDSIFGYCNADNLYLQPGGQVMYAYVPSGGVAWAAPSSPYKAGFSLFGVSDTNGNGLLPTYEVRLLRSVFQYCESCPAQFCIGYEDNDSNNCYNMALLGLGVEYAGSKNWKDIGDQWDNPLYYPTFYFIDSVGVEGARQDLTTKLIHAYPNPFNPAITIDIPERLGASSMEAFSVDGRRVAEMDVMGKSRVTWDASHLSAGVYVVRVVGERGTAEKRVLLAK